MCRHNDVYRRETEFFRNDGEDADDVVMAGREAVGESGLKLAITKVMRLINLWPGRQLMTTPMLLRNDVLRVIIGHYPGQFKK